MCRLPHAPTPLGRSVTFSDKKFLATSLAGLLPIAHIARNLELFKNAKEAISVAVPCKYNTQYSPEVMFEQRVLALTAGYEDLNDHDQLFHDPGFWCRTRHCRHRRQRNALPL